MKRSINTSRSINNILTIPITINDVTATLLWIVIFKLIEINKYKFIKMSSLLLTIQSSNSDKSRMLTCLPL